MPEATRQAYRKALKTWMTGAAAVAAALVLVAAYYGYISREMVVVYQTLRVGVWLVFLAFLLPSLYYLVLGVLPDEEAAESKERPNEPRRPLNP